MSISAVVPSRAWWRVVPAHATWLGLLAVAAAAPLDTLSAQYFGQNRVRWEQFDVRVLRTAHFDIHYDRAAEPTIREMARKAERWYTRFALLLGHNFTERKPLILYTNHPDFQQTTLANTPLSEGTRGFAEGLRDRLVMPLTGVGADNDHVLGHEIAHLFQFDMAESAGGVATMSRLPLWLVEGMAEYVSLGSDDPNTAMWLRSALASGALPTIAQLTTDPRIFPYRYGHAFWAYLGGRWGDEAVAALFRAALRVGIANAVPRTLGVTVADLERSWHESISETYAPLMSAREGADQIGRRLGTPERLTLNPQLSPDGTRLAYLGQDALGRIDVRVRDMVTGRTLRSFSSSASDGHTDAIAFLYASGSWSPDSRQYVQVVVRRGDAELAILDATSGKVNRRVRVPRVQAISAVSWSPNGEQLAIAGSRDGQGDLFLYDLRERTVQQLTFDGYAELHPAWSPDGRYIAVATDRHEGTDLGVLRYGRLKLALIDPVGGRVRMLPDLGERTRAINPQWSGDGRSIFFIGEVNGVADVYRLDLARRVFDQITNVRTGISGITPRSPALTVATATEDVVVTVFSQDRYTMMQLDPARVQPRRRLAANVPLVTEPIIDELGGVLPPNVPSPSPIIDEMLADGAEGLPGPTAGAATTRPYQSRLALEGVGLPQAGVSAGPNGSAVGGGASVFWGDLLARRRLGVVVQAQGRVQDVGGQLFYLNSASRWNLFASAGRVPQAVSRSRVATGEIRNERGQLIPVALVERGIVRTITHDATVGAQYPFSRTQRIEFAATGTRLSQSLDATRDLVSSNTGQVLERDRIVQSLGPALQFAQGSVALVGDNAVFGFTSPLVGWRYRLEYAHTTGRIQTGSFTLDGRWYRPVLGGSLALRGLHVGRLGRDAMNGALAPLTIAQSTLLRGYSVDSWTEQDCPGTTSRGCALADNAFGSRFAVVNAEYRVPARAIGLSALPVEFAPFFDAGLAWRAGDVLRWSGPLAIGSQRPLLSYGLTSRLNAGALIVEFFYARPLQRGMGGTFGFSMAPGW
jgi:hypothetical protein